MRHTVTAASLFLLATACEVAPAPSNDAGANDSGLDAARDGGSVDGASVADTGADAARGPDAASPPDAQSGGDAASEDAAATDAGTAPTDAALPHDAAVVLPAASCGSASVTGYTPVGGGTCGYGAVAAHMPPLFAAGYTIAAAELFYGFPAAQGGGSRPEGQGCGECMEVTVGDRTTVVMITDVCDPGCCANCPHGAPSVDVAPTAHGDLMTANAGSTLGNVRVVPCPSSGTIRAYVDPLTQPFYTRLMVYSHAIALESVEFRGAGPGVTSPNPWTPLTRSWTNQLELTGVDPRRGGTGIELRVTSVQGEVLASTTLIPLDDGTDVDLGIQFHDLRAAGMTCAYEPLRSIYADGFSSTVFSGFTAEAWRDWGSYSATIDLAASTGCHAGSACASVAYAAFGGFAFGSNQLIPLEDAPRLDLWARVANGTPTLRVQPYAADGVTCSAITLPAITTSWTHVTLDLTASCPAGARLSRFTIQNGAGNATVVFDDVQLLAP
ncbi:MAG: expansin-like protein [Sandaracinus sp.]